jgi:chaperonin GroES
MTMKPMRDFIIVSPIKTESKTPSGLLYTPETVDQKVITGTVLSVGSGHLLDNGQIAPLEVAAGDTVLFSKQTTLEVQHQGEKVYLMREEQVMAVVS